MSFVVGLTGGIACGKSTVARRMVELGADLIDADVIAREVVLPGTDGLRGVVQRFGREVLQADGQLNRAGLGAIVFADPGALTDLNGILHPLIEAEIHRRLEVNSAEVAVIDAALLVEMGLNALCDLTVVVWAEPELQIARLATRNGLTETESRQRLASQMSNGERLAHADLSIDNNAGLDELLKTVDTAWATIQAAAQTGSTD